jgi:hypothetical protein
MLTKEKIVDVMGAFPLHADEWVDEDFVRFARAIESLVRERTIDECVAECMAEGLIGQWDDDFDVGYNKAALDCRNKIRALKEKK